MHPLLLRMNRAVGALCPARLLAIVIATHLVLWTIVPTLVHSAPPIDVIEGYVFGPHWMLISYKHPMLPSWFLEAGRVLTGRTIVTGFLLSQMFVAATMACTYLLGRDLLGPARAAAGAMLMGGIAYYSWISTEFNHNVAQMPFVAAGFLAVWRAVERRSALWWLVAGIAGGIVCYAKLSAVLFPACAGAWMLTDAQARRELLTWRPWFGVAVMALIVLPLFLDLAASDFSALRVAEARSRSAHAVAPLAFLGRQVAAATAMIVLVAIALRVLHAAPEPAAILDGEPIPPRNLHFLAICGLGPVLSTAVLAAATGTGLRGNWGAAMLGLTGLFAIAALRHRLSRAALERIFAGAMFYLVIGPLAFATAILVQGGGDKVPRPYWPQAEIAQAFRTLWQKETGTPLRTVAGHSWVAGMVAITGGAEMPDVVIQGEFDISPWVTLDEIHRHGILVVNQRRHPTVPVIRPDWPQPTKTGALTFEIRRLRKPMTLVIDYAIVPPTQPRP